jgi:hypothetical protein
MSLVVGWLKKATARFWLFEHGFPFDWLFVFAFAKL